MQPKKQQTIKLASQLFKEHRSLFILTASVEAHQTNERGLKGMRILVDSRLPSANHLFPPWERRISMASGAICHPNATRTQIYWVSLPNERGSVLTISTFRLCCLNLKVAIPFGFNSWSWPACPDHSPQISPGFQQVNKWSPWFRRPFHPPWHNDVPGSKMRRYFFPWVDKAKEHAGVMRFTDLPNYSPWPRSWDHPQRAELAKNLRQYRGGTWKVVRLTYFTYFGNKLPVYFLHFTYPSFPRHQKNPVPPWLLLFSRCNKDTNERRVVQVDLGGFHLVMK